MAKRLQDTQLTKDNFDATDDKEDHGGPGSQVDPVLATSEVMRTRK